MMRFLADESCDYVVVRTLTGLGHEVLAVADMSPRAGETICEGDSSCFSRVECASALGTSTDYSPPIALPARCPSTTAISMSRGW